jgi:hypothetical protein
MMSSENRFVLFGIMLQGECGIMNTLRTMLVASAFVTAATLAMATTSPTASKSGTAIVRSDEISAYRRTAPVYQPRPYRGFADPSFGPDGKPYPVPEYLRNQSYIDMGYGRFQSCSNR